MLGHARPTILLATLVEYVVSIASYVECVVRIALYVEYVISNASYVEYVVSIAVLKDRRRNCSEIRVTG
jgi:hypothetical protein